MLNREQNEIVAKFQAKAEKVVPLGIYDPDLDQYQTQVRDIIRTLTADLINGSDPDFALKLANMDLNTVKWQMGK